MSERNSLSPRDETLVDAAGTAHRTAAAGARIISLVPSLTELLFDLGLGDQVVGRTAFCLHPKGKLNRATSVGGTKTINAGKLHRLVPTHIVVNIDETPQELARDLASAGYTVVVTHPIEVTDNLGLYRLLGGLFGKHREAQALCRRFEVALAAAQSAAQAFRARRVLYLIWQDPWMSVARDTYISRMLALAGLQTVPAAADRRYPSVELDECLLEDVDLVLFSSEPFPFQERHIEAFRARHPRHADKAAPIDAQMVSWYGSRAIAGLSYLADFVRTR
jgi:ABC-type Fe3+-hydroxamate transport system substrate-binding protein